MKNAIIHFGQHEKIFSGGSVFFVFGERLQEESSLSFEGQFFTSKTSDKFGNKFQNVAACIHFEGTIFDALIDDSPLLHTDFTSLEREFIQDYGLYPIHMNITEVGIYLSFLENKGLNSLRDSICCHNKVGYNKNIIFDMPTNEPYNIQNIILYCEIGNFLPIKRHMLWAVKNLTLKIQKFEGSIFIEQFTYSNSEGKVIDFKELYSEFEKIHIYCNGDIFITAQQFSIVMQDTDVEILDTQYLSVPASLRIKFATLKLPSYKRLLDTLASEITSYILK